MTVLPEAERVRIVGREEASPGGISGEIVTAPVVNEILSISAGVPSEKSDHREVHVRIALVSERAASSASAAEVPGGP